MRPFVKCLKIPLSAVLHVGLLLTMSLSALAETTEQTRLIKEATAERKPSTVPHIQKNVQKPTKPERPEKDYARAFFPAVSSGRVDEVKHILSTGKVDINTEGDSDFEHRHVVMEASLKGHADMVKLLLAKGADATRAEKDGMFIGFTPLHAAAFQGRSEVAKILLKSGISADDTLKDGYSSVFRCTWGRETRHADTLAAFLEHGVDVNVRSDKGTSLLQEAIRNRNPAVVHLLLKKGISTEDMSSEEMAIVNGIIAVKPVKRVKSKDTENEL